MFSREDKHRAFLIVMRGFMEKFTEEIETGMTDERLAERIALRLSFRLIWGGPGRFSGSCKPERLEVFAAPTPLDPKKLILTRAELIAYARAEYDIRDPAASQLSLF